MYLHTLKKILCLYVCLAWAIWGFPLQLKAQVIIDENISPNRILNQLVGEGVSIGNININCPGNRTEGLSYARFVSNNANFPLDSGIVMTTGKAADAVGPNNSNETSTAWNAPGDNDLAAIAGLSIFDACVISFDVVPVGNRIRFRYTFSSEEYEEFTPCAGANINDAFAFLITGNNPAGGSYNKRNIAIIPNTNLAVSINNVNQCTNSAYYANNNGGVEIEYDGYTVNLIAEIDVIPCESYRLELKIGDGFDGLYDSAVFIEEITSEVPKFLFNSNSVIDELVAGCINGDIEVNRNITDRAETYTIDFGGNASPGTDFTMNVDGVPATSYPFNVNYNIGETTRNLTLLPDVGVTEPQSVIIYLKAGCSNEVIDSLMVNILPLDDIVPVPEFPGGLVYRCTSGQVIQLEARLADAYTWSSSNGTFTCLDPDCQRIELVSSITETNYTLEIDIGDCTFEQTIQVLPSELALAETDISICVGENTPLEATGRETYTWTPATGLSCTDCPNPIATPRATTTYIVTGTKGTCSSEASVTVTVIQETGPEITGLQSTYCISSDPATLQATPSGGIFTIQGGSTNIPNASIFDPANLGVGIYEVIYVLGTGAGCSEQTTRIIEVYALPDAPQFENLENAYCISEAGFTLQGSPTSTQSFFKIDGNIATTFDPASLGMGIYEVVYMYEDANGCQNSIQKNVEVKALPTLSFDNLAAGYCISETSIPVQVSITEANGQSRSEIVEVLNPSLIGVGNYTIFFTYEGVNACSSQIESTVQIYPQPILRFDNLDAAYCNASLPFALQASPTGGTFEVNGTAQTQFDPAQFTPGDTPSIRYIYTDPNGCSEEINQTVSITASSVDTNNPENLLLNVCPPEFAGFELEAIDLADAEESYTYLWQPSGDTTRSIYIYDKSQEGNYTVIARDSENCPLSYRSFEVIVDCQPMLYIPTAFTPNNDQINDHLEILGEDLSGLHFRLYNRWGELIFEALKQEVRWDGKWEGKDAPEGVYIWTATYANILTGELFQKQGRITLLR